MKHVIVGTGPAGVIAAETLRRLDPKSEVTLVGNEPEAPYSRMAIPYYLVGNIAEEGTHLRHGEGHYEKLGIALRRGQVTAVDPKDHKITLDDGESLSFDKLLLATGSHAIRPPIEGIDLPQVENCWTLEDARKIADRAESGKRVVLMGAGFIGCIVLEALAQRGVDLTVVEMEDRMVPRMMDQTGGDMIKRWCESKGVSVRTSTKIESIAESDGALRLALGGGESLECDLLVCAAGVKPNIDFLDGSGIATDDGILVDNRLQTSAPDIFAAGDVAQGPDFSTGKQEIHAIQPTASEHGRLAAMNMLGHRTNFRGSLSMNVLATLGLVSSSFGLWQGVEGGDVTEMADPDGFRYIRLCFDGDVLVGALALGLTQHVGVIRGLIQTASPLGAWKERLLKEPLLVMEAYLECSQGSKAAFG
jgi:NADPH-dependent 2,4-dienoyl-CoA reductase/sulfur reductase-like enzyme